MVYYNMMNDKLNNLTAFLQFALHSFAYVFPSDPQTGSKSVSLHSTKHLISLGSGGIVGIGGIIVGIGGIIVGIGGIIGGIGGIG